MKTLILFLAILVTFTDQLQAVTKNCHQLWRSGIPREDNVRTPFVCEEFIPSINTVDPRSINLYYHTSRPIDPALTNYLEKAAESLKLSIAKAEDLFNYSGKVTLILDFNDHPRDIHSEKKTLGNAYPFFANFGEACPIIMFPKSEAYNNDIVGQLIAHEFFHCVQAQKWKEQTKMANESNIGRWSVEGSAQWFSDVIYPHVNFEYDSFWGYYNPELNLVDQSNFYTTVIFFQSMWESSRHSAFIFSDFFRKMPKTAEADQLTALASTSLIQVYYHNFVRDFISRTIKDAGNNQAPVGGVELEKIEIASTEIQDIRFPLTAYKMQGRRLVLPAKSSYSFSYVATNDVRVSYKRKNETTWHELLANFPNQLATKCSGNEEFDIVFTSTKKDFNGEIIFNLKRTELEDCGCVISSVPVDACLQGNWQTPTSTTANFMQSNYPAGTVLNKTEGIWHLHFAEHSGKFFYEAVKYDVLLATTSPTNPTVPMDITLDGQWVFEASSEAQNVCYKTRTVDVDFIATIHFPTGDVRADLLETIIPSEEGAIEFKCLNANQILYRRHSGLKNSSGRPIYVDWIFNRE